MTIGAYAFDAILACVRRRPVDDPHAAGQAALPKMTPLCLLTDVKELHHIADPLIGKFLAADPNTTEPWATLLEQTRPAVHWSVSRCW